MTHNTSADVASLPAPALVFHTLDHACRFADGVELLGATANFYSESQMRDALATPNPVRAEQPEGKWKLVPVELANQLQPGYWKEVYIGWRHMRAEITLQYDTWERLMKLLAAAPAAPGVRVDAWRGVAAEAFTNIKRSCIRGRNAANMETEKNFVATCDHIENLADEGIAALAPDGGEGGSNAS